MESESLIKLQDALWVDLPFFDEALVVDLRSACLSRKHLLSVYGSRLFALML